MRTRYESRQVITAIRLIPVQITRMQATCISTKPGLSRRLILFVLSEYSIMEELPRLQRLLSHLTIVHLIIRRSFAKNAK